MIINEKRDLFLPDHCHLLYSDMFLMSQTRDSVYNILKRKHHTYNTNIVQIPQQDDAT